MAFYDLNVCGLSRPLPFVEAHDGTVYASFVVISDTELITKAGKELAEYVKGADIIITIEAKGIALAYEISRRLNMPEFIVVRKSIKPYVRSFLHDSVRSITTEDEQELFLDEADAEKLKGKKVAIADDVISKGASLAAAERLVCKAGGTVYGKFAILAEGDAAKRTDITFLQKLPLFIKKEIHMNLLIKNASVMDVTKDSEYFADIYIKDGFFEKIESDINVEDIEKDGAFSVIDAEGQTAIPGLIDAHTHVELSMLSSASFAEALLANGTTAAVLDPHDAVNVLGHKGAKYLMKEMAETDLTPVWMASPCVPSAPGYEDCYGQIMLSDVKTMIEDYGMYGIAEAMDYNRVIYGEESLAEILSYGRENNLKIDGHAPCVRGDDLDTYIKAGISSDHESVTVEEQLEKFNKGMYVIIRRGSLKEPANAADLLKLTGDSPRILLSTDGCITAKDMLEHGHMNYAVAQLVEEGVSPLQALKMASLYPAKAYGLEKYGAIAKGYKADLVLIKDKKDFKVSKVIINGKNVPTSYPRSSFPKEVTNSIHHRLLTAEDISIPLPIKDGHVKVNIMQITDGTLATVHETRILSVSDNHLILDDDLMYCAVIDRYRENGSIGVGIISNAGALDGALAGSIAQDTQNLIAFGNSFSDIIYALNMVIKKQGGVSFVRKEKEEFFLALPVLGILSQEPIESFVKESDKLIEEIKKYGCILNNPLLTMSLQIPLAVIPEVAITNRGLLDISNQIFIPVCEPV